MSDYKDNYLLKESNITYNNFMLEIKSNKEHIDIDKQNLVENFKLDIEYTNDEKGLYIYQNGNILQKPYDVSLSSRKINQEIKYLPIGFSQIFYADNSSSIFYMNPPEAIPIGCWCTVDSCMKVGPSAHSNTCSYPNQLSLKLTLKGFINCIFSKNKTYRNKLIKSDIPEISNLVHFFTSRITELSNDVSYNDNDKIDIYIKAAIDTTKNYKLKLLNTIPDINNKNLNNIFTNIEYKTVKKIPNLKKGKLNYFHGATVLQYISIIDGIPKRSSIRIYENGKITIIPCNWDKYKSYENMIKEIYNRINKTLDINIYPKNAMISVADATFRLISEKVDKGINLETFYNAFHPTDEMGNPLEYNDYMYTVTLLYDDEEHIKYIVKEGKNTYLYKINEEGRGKLSMNFLKYNTHDNTTDIYKVTAQIYNTGIVQLKMGYSDDDTKDFEKKILENSNLDFYEQIDEQSNKILEFFENIRKIIVSSIDKMHINKLDIFIDKEINKKSDYIFNVVPGVMPYAKKKYMSPGYIVDFFDDSKDEWDDNYGWSIDDSERGIIIGVNNKKNNTIYDIITGLPRLEKIIETPNLYRMEISKLLKAPLVKLENGENAYLIENYIKGKPKHWVISGNIKQYTLNDLRIYKQSINDDKLYEDKSVQVSNKKKGGIYNRPDPYSFYGKCSNGFNQYIDRIGVQSRKDNKFYPICSNITDGKTTKTARNRKEVENEMVEFILNGLSEEQLKEANINPNIEVTLYGAPIKDKYAGTFIPGTIDIGNIITFWDDGEWAEGTLIEYHKSHGLGNDLNHTSFILQKNINAECNCVFNEKQNNDNKKNKNNDKKRDTTNCSLHVRVRGEQFHPKHRENRNFPGLNNIFPDENQRKEFLIKCAKKLGIVRPEIEIAETKPDNKYKVINKLANLFNINYESFHINYITNETDPFIEKNIIKLTQQPYSAFFIPNNSIRCLLFIIDNENEQYLIDSYNKVIKVSINFQSSNNYNNEDDDIFNTIIDGYIKDKDFYPFDIIMKNGKIVNSDYLFDNEEPNEYYNYTEEPNENSRIIILQDIANKSIYTKKTINSIHIKKPLGYYRTNRISDKIKIDPFIGPIDPDDSLINFIKINRKQDDNILFIPHKGKSKYMIWRHHTPNNPIVVQLLKKVKNKDGYTLDNTWYIGLVENDKNGIKKYWKLFNEPISFSKSKDNNGNIITYNKYDYIRIRLNIDKNGILYNDRPYLNPIKVSKDDAKSFEETKIDINLITRSIKDDVFKYTDKWILSKIKKVFISGKSSRLPLIDKIYNFL